MYNNSQRRKGQVGITSDRGRLKLSLPRVLFDGQQKYIHLRCPDTPEYRGKAENVVKQIEIDVANGSFDFTFKKYLTMVNVQQPQLTVIQSIQPKPELSLQQCWDLYFDYKKTSWKKGEDGTKSTMDYMKTLEKYIHKCGVTDFDALAVRKWFLDNTTESMTKRCLTHLNAAVRFAIKHRKISLVSSPFEGMPQEFTHRYEIESEPMALSLEEKQKIFEAFQNQRGNWNGRGYTGYSYSFYYPFVKGLFLIGRRPEEICQYRWGMVKSGLLHIPGRITKTSRDGKFPLYPELEELLNSIKPENPDPNAWLFPSPKGLKISYGNFSNKAWNKVVDPLFPDRNLTPRCGRDTFITEQIILHNRSESVVAKWCDTSPDEIRRRYLGDAAIYELRPGSSDSH
ncbi:Integrase family protein [Planktothrix tepida]|uniref:Integrase family protein n=1 Tax=Planktothrix tepida PCC 9214 TaxID=671072 RepID=A0A1J1LHY8_9CYAN|nr:DUF3596 domain-containing protein [Planktothrix tepida]CAD5910566.1 Integrase family protein [Planktothrix tepida]CAD5985049.1 Integrase family protein [Planktothrix tepida]CUR32120.1 Integrase family protein [Planktothrix tepida PCC 9214]